MLCRREEIRSWLKRNYAGVDEWCLDDLDSDEDRYRESSREGAAEVLARVAGALQLAVASKKKKFVWVSHSAFLSCLFALTDRLPISERWLENGAWAKLDVSEEDINGRMAEKINPKPRPFLKLKDAQLGNALKPVSFPTTPIGVYLYTTEMLASLAFATQVTKSVCIGRITGRGLHRSVLRMFVSVLQRLPVCDDGVLSMGLRMQQQIVAACYVCYIANCVIPCEIALS